MAKANPASSTPAEKPKKETKADEPQIEYYGEESWEVDFEVDPKAKLIRVYGNGMVLVDY